MCGQTVTWTGNLLVRIPEIMGDEAHHSFLRGWPLQRLLLAREILGFEIDKIGARGPECVLTDAAFQQV
jgi:hypothetical protein